MAKLLRRSGSYAGRRNFQIIKTLSNIIDNNAPVEKRTGHYLYKRNVREQRGASWSPLQAVSAISEDSVCSLVKISKIIILARVAQLVRASLHRLKKGHGFYSQSGHIREGNQLMFLSRIDVSLSLFLSLSLSLPPSLFLSLHLSLSPSLSLPLSPKAMKKKVLR